MSFGETLTPLAGITYDRLDLGSYMLQGATLDQLDQLSITNRGVVANPQKPAQYTVKYSVNKNRPASVVSLPDFNIQAWTSIQFLPGSFTQADVENVLSRLAYFYTGAPLTKLLRGER